MTSSFYFISETSKSLSVHGRIFKKISRVEHFRANILKYNRSSLAHSDFVEDAIREQVESGSALKVALPPLVVNTLSV